MTSKPKIRDIRWAFSLASAWLDTRNEEINADLDVSTLSGGAYFYKTICHENDGMEFERSGIYIHEHSVTAHGKNSIEYGICQCAKKSVMGIEIDRVTLLTIIKL